MSNSHALNGNNAVHISSNFDGGNINCLACEAPDNIRLEIEKDHKADTYQWFYFKMTGAQGQECRLVIENAKGAAYIRGWENYAALASYDREHWFRVPTVYENGQLVICHTPEQNSVFYAYFAPYSMERHADFIARAQKDERVSASVLGQTLDGQDVGLLTIGTPAPGKKSMWITARQHPGETMAEWWVEGFVDRLLDVADPVSLQLLEHCVFYIVPNMNPDGSKRGHLRTNACGVDLNREWGIASKERSPEVLYVMKSMQETGVDFCLDVHGDEALPYNFVGGSEGVLSFTPQKQALLDNFQEAYKKSTAEFQTVHGYGITPHGKANLTMCNNYVAQTYDCLAMILEMPFKDNADMPNPKTGWSSERSAKLGADVLEAMLAVAGDL